MTAIVPKQTNKKGWFLIITPAILAGLIVLTIGVTKAAGGSLSVTPSTGLSDGQKITVSGSGFAKNSTGTITECNGDPSQPTVGLAGNQVPVGCANPLNSLVTTDSKGNLPATSYTVHTGTVGPAATGTDSAGNDAATDAAKYPCPPTAAQIAAGVSCNITFGDAGGDDISQNIAFTTSSGGGTSGSGGSGSSTGSSSSTSSPASSSPSTSSSAGNAPTTTSSNTTSTTALPNTGPGDVIGLFIGAVIVGTLGHYSYFNRRDLHRN